jgi:rhodanese-related sulfurtransferase
MPAGAKPQLRDRIPAPPPVCYRPDMDIPQTTPPEAYETLQRDPRAVYLDVRTEDEYAGGHPAGARNVPVFFFDPATGRPRPNPDFLAVVRRNFPPDTKLLVGCQSGMRSQRACELLREEGWSDVTNVQGSYGGSRDAGGNIVVAGWKEAGLPVETGASRGASYADLRPKA